MRAMQGRPVLLQRYPNGAGGPSFFQKRVPDARPEWLQTAVVSTPNGTTSDALVAADLAHVIWAVNIGCIGFHVWPSQADDQEHADELRIDLDPSPGVTFAMLQEAAREVRRLFDEHGVSAMPKTTGNRGIHIYVRLQPRWTSYEVRSAAVAVARELERRRPELMTVGLVEGGARPARLHRLQPERAAQDDLRRLVGAGATGRAGVDALRLGRARYDPAGRADHRDGAGAACGPRATRGRRCRTAPQSLEPLLAMHERDTAAGLPDAAWPPVYPKMPGEPPRVAPSRARKAPSA